MPVFVSKADVLYMKLLRFFANGDASSLETAEDAFGAVLYKSDPLFEKAVLELEAILARELVESVRFLCC